jgi:hypothetical protein
MGGFICFACCRAKEANEFDGSGGSGRFEPSHDPVNFPTGARPMGSVGQPASLSQERPLGGRVLVLCGRISGPMAGVIGLVGGGLSYSGA